MMDLHTAGGHGQEKLTRFLGWFSLGLGACELLAPQLVSRTAGMRRARTTTIRLCGVREIASGLLVLSAPTAKAGLWTRVIGDAIDLAGLNRTTVRRRERTRRASSTAAVLGVTALDLYSAVNERSRAQKSQPVRIKESLAILKSPEELYPHWRDLGRLPQVMSFLEGVEVIDERTSHWRTKPVMGRRIEWTSEITDERQNEYLAWRAIPGSDIEHTGRVSFRRLPSDHGTAITLELEIGGSPAMFGSTVSSLLSTLSGHKLRRDLARFKQLMEVGEVVSTRGQPAGRSYGETKFDEAAWL